MRVDQWIPAFHWGDAIGDTSDHIKNFLRSKGYESQIYCLSRDPGLEDKSRLVEDYPKPEKNDITILHYALPSPMTEKLMSLPCRKVILYHNITPHSFFEKYSAEMVRITFLGRVELEKLAENVDFALADSEYNCQELRTLGFRQTSVFPLFIDFQKYKRPISRFVYDLYNDDRTNILFVGRIVPNKRIDELIKVVFYYKKYISPLVRLIVIGKTSSLPKYFESLVMLADEFYLKPEEISFTGHIPDEEMYALYRASHVFLSLSEHEGFGLPFMESMVFDLPVIAYNCTAVPYTLGGSGVLINRKNVDYISELVHVVAKDKKLREKIIKGQKRRLNSFKKLKMENTLMNMIKELGKA